MLKIEVNKVKETLGARANKISRNIFHNNEDVSFLNYIKNDYYNELPPRSRSKILL